jgi:hypothetical protein
MPTDRLKLPSCGAYLSTEVASVSRSLCADKPGGSPGAANEALLLAAE